MQYVNIGRHQSYRFLIDVLYFIRDCSESNTWYLRDDPFVTFEIVSPILSVHIPDFDRHVTGSGGQ